MTYEVKRLVCEDQWKTRESDEPVAAIHSSVPAALPAMAVMPWYGRGRAIGYATDQPAGSVDGDTKFGGAEAAGDEELTAGEERTGGGDGALVPAA